ncbi:glycosyltransferase [Geobacter argillaceus]|uniref:Glycosyltransferase involved in cell wall biosynthesis n=1 Tax=Geobacter argillaceus TaxID=345631 RepID=A0A562VN06_9BACT|nr:glycosyltransferase [Geobacter argillaceus]TWJ19289.1 glycosyltransferase involved in cell wall biosynthesis [Geobacter argillaceus]
MQPVTRWLVLSYFSRIDGMACAQHLDDRIPYLRANGIEPLLLTGVCGGRWPQMVHSRVPSLGPSGIRFELRHLRRRSKWWKMLAPVLTILLLPFYLLEKLIIDLDSQWSWFPLAILKGGRLCRQHQPEVIYSTGGPASAHLAAAIISRRNGLPWIAEVQDPLVHGDWLRSRRALAVFSWLERLICRRADAIVFLTDEAREAAERRTGLGRRGWTIFPGADPSAMPDVVYERSAFCRFAHFGSLGGSRNLKVFLEGLRLLLEERPELADVIRLDLYGTCDRLSRRLISEFLAPGVIRDYGRIPRNESLVAMKHCDVLLLIQNTEEFSSETIPSKTYEYLHVGRPVLGLVHHNPGLSRMLAALGHTSVSAGSPEAVKQAIADCYSGWKSAGNTPGQPVSPYTVAAAVTEIMSIAAVVGQKDSGGRHG